MKKNFPGIEVKIDEPAHPGGSFWVDVISGAKRQTLQLRAGEGFGLFKSDAGYGEGPAEIYHTPECAARRLTQLFEDA